jgi:formylglycine-generating enzyme
MGILGKHARRFSSCIVIGASVLSTSKASADVFNMPAGQTSLQFVTVGDPGNAPDANGLGSVPYTFQMGEFDVTAAQYTTFLNSVAAADPYGLYNPSMGPTPGIGTPGITRSGTAGNYTYSVASGSANLPVNEVSWGDAARFCNWLANGQPITGVENASSTEDGSYALKGAVTDGQLSTATRSPSATFVIPNENEWYKAAYYKGGSTNAGYWLYPTQSNSPPNNLLSMTGTNNANFTDPVLGYTDPSTFLTPVGFFAGSPGPYGTFDMGGDVSQWHETLVNSPQRVFRGGPYNLEVNYLESSSFFSGGPSGYEAETGFRIAEVPEPSSVGILVLGAVGLLRRRRRAI